MKKGFVLMELLAVIIVTIVLIGTVIVIKNMTGNKTAKQGKPNTSNNNVYEPGQLVQYDPVKNKSCTSGDTCYKWRVITVGDTASNSTITLQMDHNLINQIAWIAREDSKEYNMGETYHTLGYYTVSPATSLKALERATASWDDSLKLNYTYDSSLEGTNEGHNYGTLSCTNGTCVIDGAIEKYTITTNLKARMITGEEVRALTVAAGATSETTAYNWTVASTDCYYFSDTGHNLGTWTKVSSGQTGSTSLSWLLENTVKVTDSGATANTYGERNFGYWTLSPYPYGLNSAWFMDKDGYFCGLDAYWSWSAGVRPVIEIPKRKLKR